MNGKNDDAAGMSSNIPNRSIITIIGISHQSFRFQRKNSNSPMIPNRDKKLFITYQVKKGTENLFLEGLKPAAGCCTGDVYVGMIPHPGDWVDTENDIHLWVSKK